jgi:Mg/Co/Ni transporter MgtE
MSETDSTDDTAVTATDDTAVVVDQVLEILQSEERQDSDLAFLLELDDSSIGQLIESVPPESRLAIWKILPPENLWLVLNTLQYSTAGHLVETLSEAERAQLVLLADDADILGLADYLPDEFLDAILEEVDAARATEMQTALAYEEHQVGRHVTRNILRVRPRLPLSRLLARLHTRADNPPVAVYVINRDGELQGQLDFRHLLLADPATSAGELAHPVAAFNDTDDLQSAVREADTTALSEWLPVIREERVEGAISASVIIDEMVRANLETIVTEARSDEEDLFTPVKTAARTRALWLVINLATAFLASAVIGLFEGALREVVALAILMPVVASMGGIAGSQTLAVALRGLALNHLSEANLKLVLAKESRIALVNGIGLGCIIGLVVWQWFDSVALGVVIFIAILLNGLAAAAAGTFVPFWLKRVDIDPAVSGSVILTTVTDVVGFFVFLGLGSLVFLGGIA